MQLENNGIILIVETDKFMRIILEKMCSKIYEVHTAENGKKALEKLESLSAESMPWVIISNQMMPDMLGTEFMKESQQFAPNAVKILLTAQDQTGDIIKAMKEANAYIFQSKPFQNLALMQSVKVSMDKYKSRTRLFELQNSLSQLTRDYEIVSSRLKKLEKPKEKESKKEKSTDIGTARIISALSLKSEQWYFSPHTKDVTGIVTYLGQALELSDKDKSESQIAALLHGAYAIGLKPRLQLSQHYYFQDGKEKQEFIAEYTAYFNKFIEGNSFGRAGELALMIWERYDGKGFPQGLGGMQLPMAGQIVSIANLYHDHVYKLKREDVQYLKAEGKISQEYETTLQRHNDAIAFLFKHIKWYDGDLLEKFKDAARRQLCEQLKPKKETLSIVFNAQDNILVDKSLGKKGRIQEDPKSMIKQVFTIDTDGKRQPKILDSVKAIDLEEGMTIGSDLHTNSGQVVTKKGTYVDSELIKKILNYVEAGSISRWIELLMDDPKEDEREVDLEPKSNEW
ncbi:MAG: hypothetical protein Kapaf2KO_03690 [Candidatus Kapaibacteriales bacterium]